MKVNILSIELIQSNRPYPDPTVDTSLKSQPLIQVLAHPAGLPKLIFTVNVNGFYPFIYIEAPDDKTIHREFLIKIKDIFNDVDAGIISYIFTTRKPYYCGISESVSLLRVEYENQYRRNQLLQRLQQSDFTVYYGHVDGVSQFCQHTGFGELREVQLKLEEATKCKSQANLEHKSVASFGDLSSILPDQKKPRKKALCLLSQLPDLVSADDIEQAELGKDVQARYSDIKTATEGKKSDISDNVPPHIYDKLAIVGDQTDYNNSILAKVREYLVSHRNDKTETRYTYELAVDELNSLEESENKRILDSGEGFQIDIEYDSLLKKSKNKISSNDITLGGTQITSPDFTQYDYHKNCFNQTLGISQLTKTQKGSNSRDENGNILFKVNPEKAQFSGVTVYDNMLDFVNEKPISPELHSDATAAPPEDTVPLMLRRKYGDFITFLKSNGYGGLEGPLTIENSEDQHLEFLVSGMGDIWFEDELDDVAGKFNFNSELRGPLGTHRFVASRRPTRTIRVDL